MPSDSHAILLTPPGAAAIAVIRLTGPKVDAFLASHFSMPVPAGKCVHGVWSDHGEVLDDPVVARSPCGRHADVNVHGGPWVIRSFMALAEREGFLVAHGSDSAGSAEAVDAAVPLEHDMLRALPAVTTELALERLLAQPAAWRALAGRLTTGDGEKTREAELASLLADNSLAWLLRPPRVAIVGAPNVGKSTLANALFARQRSITADLPGTTRDWVGETANIDGLAVELVDTPGLRTTADAIEAVAIERASDEIRRADLILLVLDPTQPLKGPQAELGTRFPTAIRVINKCDAAPTWKGEVSGLPTVATTGRGLDAVRAAVREHFHIDDRPSDAARWWTPGQRDAVARAAADISAFARWVDSQLGADATVSS